MKFPGKVENNQLIIFPKQSYENRLKKLNGKRVTVDVSEYRENRNNAQNRYYWAILKYLEEHSETGYNKDEFHVLFKAKFLSTKHEILGGDYVDIVSTSKLNTKQFAEYVDNVKHFCNVEIGCYIPDATEIEMFVD